MGTCCDLPRRASPWTDRDELLWSLPRPTPCPHPQRAMQPRPGGPIVGQMQHRQGSTALTSAALALGGASAQTGMAWRREAV